MEATGSMTREQEFGAALADFVRRSRETRYIPLYDSNNIATGAVGTTQFFTNTAGKNLLQSNMPANSVLPAPRQFLTESLAVSFPVDTTTADAGALLAGALIQWFISDKEYLRAPVFAAPGGTGVAGAIATGVAATTFESFGNGWPSPAARFYLHKPGQLIKSQENFRVDFVLPSAITLAATRRIWIALWGTELRAVQ